MVLYTVTYQAGIPSRRKLSLVNTKNVGNEHKQ